MFSRPTIVLDCGPRLTALGIFSRRRDRLRLTHFAVVHHAGPAGAREDWLAATGAALRELARGRKAGESCVVVLPAHLTLFRTIKVPRVDAARRAKIIRFEAAQHIPSALAEVAWDSVVTNTAGPDDEVLIAAAKGDVVEPLCRAAEAAGLVPAMILPSPLACLAGFRLAPVGLGETALLLGIEPRAAALIRVEPGRFSLRTCALPVAPIGQAAGDGAPAADRVVQELRRASAQWRELAEGSAPDLIYLAGTGAGWPGMAAAVRAEFKREVRPLVLTARVDCSSIATGEGLSDELLTNLAGTAAVRLFPDQPAVDLLPHRRRRQRNFRRHRPWLVVAAGLALAAPLPPLVHFHRLADAAQAKAGALGQSVAPLRARSLHQRDQLQQLERVRREIAALQSLHDRRFSWLNLLRDLQERLSAVDEVWLDRLQVVPGAPLRLRVSGRLLDHANSRAPAGSESVARIQELLATFGDSPFVGAIEGEQFDHGTPGVLRFDFLLVTSPRLPL